MIVLEAARILDPATGKDEIGDVVIEAGRIARIGKDAAHGIPKEGVRWIAGKGRWLVPGFVDMHTHLREPGHEYKETIRSGLRAAAAGGFTTVCSMPNTNPVHDTRAVTDMITARAKEVPGMRLLPMGAITKGLKGEELTEMAELKEAGIVGVSDDGRCVMNASVMRRAMEYARTFDLLVCQHAEDHHLTEGAQMHEGVISTRLGLRGWPREAEDIIVARDLILAEMTGARYHIAHISSLGAVRLLREAKSRGLKVSAEVTPHHLTLSDEAVLGYNTACKVNPPLRTAEDRHALQEALSDGTLDCIATDHAPHSTLEKDCEFAAAAPGMIGLETTFPVLLELVRNKTLTPLRLIETLTSAPAKLLGLEAGSLRQGARADITLVDPELRWTLKKEALQSLSHNSPWLNRELVGAVTATIAQGEVVYER